LESHLVVIGLNHRSAPIEIRERFWLSESRRFDVLARLSAAQGIAEAVVLATCNRTEFIVWAPPAAAEWAVREFLTAECGLTDENWKLFYRLQGEEALEHVFRVTAGLDSMVLGEPEITGQLKSAWAAAQRAGTTGRFLDAVFQKALSVSKRVRTETAIGAAAVSVPYAAVELARQIFGKLDGRKILILGAGKMGELSARYLLNNGASAVWVTNRTYGHAVQLAQVLGGLAVRFEDRWEHLADADIVISSTGCPHVILNREDAERMHQQRHGRPVFLIDIAVPRDIDPAVREIGGVFLYDIDDLEHVVARNLNERQAAAAEAEKMIAREAPAFCTKLAAERVVPTIVAVRARLEEIRRQELERYRGDYGPFSPAEEQALDQLSEQLVRRIAGQLAGELKQVPGQPEQDALSAAIRRLFHVQPARPVVADGLD
jgi:glutamyl-tRNA reductase